MIDAAAMNNTRPRVGMVHGARRGALAGMTAVGGSLMIGGALLPWLSVYAGLETLRGISGVNGRVLIGIGALAIALAIAYAVRPTASIRSVIGLVGFGASGFAAWVVAQLLGSYSQLSADPFAVASLGAGVFVALGGALCVLATVLVPQAGATSAQVDGGLASGGELRVALLTAATAFLLSAAMIHLAVVGPHLSESTLFAVFFVGAGLAQIAAALVLTVRPYRGLLGALAIGNALIIAVWVVSRTVGLPFGPTPGVPESVSLPDVLATIAEAVVVVLTAGLARRSRRSVVLGTWVARGGSVAAVLVAAAMAVVAIVGVQSGGG